MQRDNFNPSLPQMSSWEHIWELLSGILYRQAVLPYVQPTSVKVLNMGYTALFRHCKQERGISDYAIQYNTYV